MLLLEPGCDLLIADAPEEFAAKTVKLLQDVGARTRLARHARRTVEERYQWSSIVERLIHTYRLAIGRFQDRQGNRTDLDASA